MQDENKDTKLNNSVINLHSFNLKAIKQLLLKKNVLFVIGIVGILLIFFIDFTPKKSTKDTQTISNADYCDDYAKNMEIKLTEIISSMEGAGNVKVMVTMETSEQYVYAKAEKTDTDFTQKTDDVNQKQTYQNDYIIVENNDGAKVALTETTLEPEIKGVAVVCTGGDNIKVIKSITEMVSVVANIPTSRICVIKMI